MIRSKSEAPGLAIPLSCLVALVSVIRVGRAEETRPGTLDEARRRASADGKYLLVFFRGARPGVRRRLNLQRDDTPAIIERALEKWRGRLDAYTVDLSGPAADKAADAFGISSGPTVLMLAPNGAITGHFHGLRSLSDVEGRFVSAAFADILKALQDKNVVFLRVLNERTESRAEVIRSTDAVAKVLRGVVTSITLDPASKDNEPLLETLGLESGAVEAVTFVLSPSGGIVDRIDGAPSTGRLFAGFQKALAAGAGCGSGGGGGGGCGGGGGEPCD